jgi:hypothetical protein
MEDGWGGNSGMLIRSWVDSDGDGLPDDWETKWGLNPHDPSDAAQDLNGNGLSNLLARDSRRSMGFTVFIGSFFIWILFGLNSFRL